MMKYLGKAYLWLLLLLLYAPILIIMIFSFTEAKVLGNWTGFSTKLYTSLFCRWGPSVPDQCDLEYTGNRCDRCNCIYTAGKCCCDRDL